MVELMYTSSVATDPVLHISDFQSEIATQSPQDGPEMPVPPSPEALALGFAGLVPYYRGPNARTLAIAHEGQSYEYPDEGQQVWRSALNNSEQERRYINSAELRDLSVQFCRRGRCLKCYTSAAVSTARPYCGKCLTWVKERERDRQDGRVTVLASEQEVAEANAATTWLDDVPSSFEHWPVCLFCHEMTSDENLVIYYGDRNPTRRICEKCFELHPLDKGPELLVQAKIAECTENLRRAARQKAEDVRKRALVQADDDKDEFSVERDLRHISTVAEHRIKMYQRHTRAVRNRVNDIYDPQLWYRDDENLDEVIADIEAGLPACGGSC